MAERTQLTDAWRHCIGTGRANLSLRAEHRAALEKVQEDVGFRYIRGHGLLSDDMGVLQTSEWLGRPFAHYNFRYVDQVLDGYLCAGIRPILELGFMPEALASGEDTVFWWKGNITPPTQYSAWAQLVTRLLGHLIERFGPEEVHQWPIEVWNEPNLTVFWKDADQQAYFKLYETTARAIKHLDGELRVGGPAISPGANAWWRPFAEFVESRDVPLDFLAYHTYTSGPAQHVPFGVYQTLRHPDDLLLQFAEPERLLQGTSLARLPKLVTEFNSSYRPDNPIHDTAYNAAYLAPTLVAGGDVADSFSYWTLCDVFEEAGIPSSLYHGGFGLLTHGLIPKPTYHLYTFMARLAPKILARGADHVVTADRRGSIKILAWQPLEGTRSVATSGHRIRLIVPATAAEYYLHRSKTNEEVGNGRAAWLDMGSPCDPDREQRTYLRECAEPIREHARVSAQPDGAVHLELTLGLHEVTLVELHPVTSEPFPWSDDARLLGEGAA